MTRSVARRDGMIYPLRPRAFSLLGFLIKNAERVVSKEEIIDAVWDGRSISDSALATTVRDVRSALGDTDDKPRLILTHYGRGLQFTPPEGGLVDAATLSTLPPMERACTIAVLHFDCLGDDPALAHRAIAFTEDLAMHASKFRDMKIVRQASAKKTDGAMPTTREIGTQLGAHYSVRGSIRYAGDGLRISVQVFETELETLIWGGQFDLPISGSIDQYDEVTRTIVSTIVARSNQHILATLVDKPLDKLTAYQCYLLGRELFYKFTPEDLDEAIRHYERAISMDPGFANVHAGLSYALTARAVRSFGSSEETAHHRAEHVSRAKIHAAKAIEIDRYAPFTWVAIARAHLAMGEFNDAISAATRAIELNPVLSWGYYMLGSCYWPNNRCEEAIEAFDKAIKLSPEDGHRWTSMAAKACALAVSGRYEEAITWSRQAQLEHNSDHFAFCGELCALGHLGRADEGMETIKRAKQSIPDFSFELVENDPPIPNPLAREKYHTGLRLTGLR